MTRKLVLAYSTFGSAGRFLVIVPLVPSRSFRVRAVTRWREMRRNPFWCIYFDIVECWLSYSCSVLAALCAALSASRSTRFSASVEGCLEMSAFGMSGLLAGKGLLGLFSGIGFGVFDIVFSPARLDAPGWERRCPQQHSSRPARGPRTRLPAAQKSRYSPHD